MAVLTPPPPTWVCLVIDNFYIYVFFFFYIFPDGYLLRSIVYNTVVCINTIIYFSMGEKIQRQAWKNAIPAYWSMFFEQNVTFFSLNLQTWRLEPVTSCILPHVGFLSRRRYEATELLETNRMSNSMSVCRLIEGFYLNLQTVLYAKPK